MLRDEARADLDGQRRFDLLHVLDALDAYLATGPLLESRSRIKRIRTARFRGYRLRVADFRVFYNVRGRTVSVARVLRKDAARRFLKSPLRHGQTPALRTRP